MDLTPQPAPPAGELKLVVFKLLAEEFAASIHQVREVIRLPGLTRMPRTPAYVVGLMNLRGKVFPVIDLKRRFRMEARASDGRTRVMVVEVGEQAMGLVVDDVVEVLRTSRDHFEPPPAMIAENTGLYLKGVVKLGERLLLLLDLNRLFSAEELAEIARAGAEGKP